MRHYGIIGYPLSHTFSPNYFTEKFKQQGIEADYKAIPIEHAHELKKFMAHTKLDAFNVTLPYKEKIIPCLHQLDSVAKVVEAVNCVVHEPEGWIGYNTDVTGFEQSLLSAVEIKHKKALIFGYGGASRAAQYVLNKYEVEYLLVSRQQLANSVSYADITQEVMEEYTLLIQTTPVGMYPHIEDCLPIPFHFIHDNHVVFDMIYNPEKTKLLQHAERRGAQIINGSEMLRIQAKASYSLFLRAT